MVFSDRAFLFLFLPLAILIIVAAARIRLRFTAILMLSFLFYYYSAGTVIWVLAASIVIAFGFGLLVERVKSSLLVLAATVVLLLPLVYFKYALFASGIVGLDPDSPLGTWLSVALPAGISFFTFQAISYVIDVHRGTIAPDRNLLRFGAYLSFFPQLIAGPIVRYSDVKEDFERDAESVGLFATGVVRFTHGLLKKLLIADNAGRIADACFSLSNDDVTFATAAIGALAYTVQIYFDFSGYSDMAIGLGKMFGIRFPENFKSPYSSRSVTEFWRRWHTTLSYWFRDYLYISLGGNRAGKARTYVNLLLVFLATGIWHGAAWTFLVWGLYHGAFIVVERAVFGSRARRLESEALRYFYLLPVAMVGWIIFRASDFDQAGAFVWALVTPISKDAFVLSPDILAACTPSALLALLLGCLEFFKPGDKAVGVWLEEQMLVREWPVLPFCYAVIGLVIVAIASLSAGFSPFLYFQF